MEIYVPENPSWDERDLPVLRGAVDLIEHHQMPATPEQISLHIGMPTNHVRAALSALAEEQPSFFNEVQTNANGDVWLVDRPTGHARRALKLWPTPEDRIDQLVKALDLAAEREPDPATKRALRKTAAYIGNAGRDLVVGILSNVIAGG